jgi:hypothetical protein
MKLPRWLVVGLLAASVLAVLGGGAWWWVTWPDRTVRELFQYVAEGRLNEGTSLLGAPPDDRRLLADFILRKATNRKLYPDTPGLMDIIRGRRIFRVNLLDGRISYHSITVERGIVSLSLAFYTELVDSDFPGPMRIKSMLWRRVWRFYLTLAEGVPSAGACVDRATVDCLTWRMFRRSPRSRIDGPVRGLLLSHWYSSQIRTPYLRVAQIKSIFLRFHRGVFPASPAAVLPGQGVTEIRPVPSKKSWVKSHGGGDRRTRSQRCGAAKH